LTTGLCCCFFASQSPGADRTGLFDPTDGYLDASAFLDSKFGFLPVIAPITEPAVGYGAFGALVFIDRKPQPEGATHPVRPNIFLAGGALTENGTDGILLGHLGSWLDGRLKSLVGMADLDLNLTLHDLENSSNDLAYEVNARGGAAGLDYRPFTPPLWFGLRYLYSGTEVGFPGFDPGQPLPERLDSDLKLASLSPSITWDARDNFFTPVSGWYASLEWPLYRDWVGSDRNFETPSLSAMLFHPLGSKFFFSGRAAYKGSTDGAPFYLRPFVSLRGLEALAYQGDRALEAEAEVRWQFHHRFSAVAFAGAGEARTSIGNRNDWRSVLTGGGGFRYLIARTYGLHMGLDVGFGPGDPVLYVVFGSAWARP